MSFADAVMRARRALDDAGYEGATVALLLMPEQVASAQRELAVATAIVDEALRPTEPTLFGIRLLAVVHGVPVYVRDEAPRALLPEPPA